MAEGSDAGQPLLRSGSQQHHYDDHQLEDSGAATDTGDDGMGADYGSLEDGPARRRSRATSVIMEPQPVTLSWHNLRVFVPDKNIKMKKTKDKLMSLSWKKNARGGRDAERAERQVPTLTEGQKLVVKGVSGAVKPGRLTAIMGASGAGKSTLMNVLTNRNLKDYRVEGEVRVNGASIGRGIRNISAYVQQNDLFFGNLTVRETLTFRAMLRMDRIIDTDTRLERVEEVLVEMGLSKCADTQVGIAGQKKGISGGETKRLSFGCEILTNPPLLFCDEPTSGLDTYMSQNLVRTLKAMTRKNRTILCTIHQPSSEIFAMFDQLLLLAEGRVAFMGPLAQAKEFFESMDYVCPINYNPADFYILTLAIEPGKEEHCRKKVNAISDRFVETEQADAIHHSIQEAVESTLDPHLTQHARSSDSRYEASWGLQFLSVLRRSWVCLMRDVVLFRARVLQTLVMALVMGLIYLRLDYNQKGVMDINGSVFVLLTQASFANVFAVANSFPHEIPIFLREYGSGMYRTDVYFLAKSLAELPTFILLPMILVTVEYWMVGMYGAWQAFLICLAVITVVSNVAVSFGLILSSAAANVNIALTLAPPCLAILMMLGGFFINSGSIPVYFVWLKYISWFNYANEFLMVNQWQHVTNITCEDNTTCHFNTGHDVLNYLSYSVDHNWLDIGLLLVLLVGFRVIAFLILLIRAKLSKT